MPHVDLGNSFQDVGQGANSFAAGLLAQRARQQTIALQEALGKANAAHLDAETNVQIPAQAAESGARTTYLGTQTEDAQAQATGREQGNLPADDMDENRLREIDPSAPKGIYQGYNKAQAAQHTKVIADYLAAKARTDAMNGRFYNRGQIAYDVNGDGVIVHPNESFDNRDHGSNGMVQPLPGVARPVNATDRKAAGSAQAGLSAHTDLTQIEQQHPEVTQEVAKALLLPSLGKLSFVPGTGEGIQQILDSFRLSGASPQAQVYLKRMFDFTGVVGPARYGLRGMQNPRTLMQLWTDFGLGQMNLSHEGILAAERNRENAVRQLQETAGPNAWNQSQSVFPQTQSSLTEQTTSPYGYHKR